MRMGKSILLIAAVLMIVAQITGCNATPSNKNEENVTPGGQTASSSTLGTAQSTVSNKPITLRIIDWSDSSKSWRDEYHKKFMEEHPNVTIEYTTMTQDQFKNTVLTAIAGGEAPDLFPVPIYMQLASAVSQNWFVPLNDLMPDGFFDKFIDGTLVEGNHYINGIYYTLPEKLVLTSVLMYYNKDILSECGLDIPKTYSEFREACKKITQKGNGKYYGLIDGGKQVSRLESLVRGLASLNGGKVGNNGLALTVNGRAPFDSDAMIQAYELLQQLSNDGSIHPDTVSLNAPEARALFAKGEAGFICQGDWCISVWQKNNPDLNFGVMPLIIPDDGQKGYLPVNECVAWIGISTQCKNPKVAAEYLSGLYLSEEFQGGTVAAGERCSVMKGINEKYMPKGPSSDYYNIAKEQTRTVPIATHVDPKVADFYAEVKTVEPSLGAIAQGVIAGGITDIKGALKQIADETTKEWKRAADAVGLDFSTFEFPNWDPMKNYTAEDYAALKKK